MSIVVDSLLQSSSVCALWYFRRSLTSTLLALCLDLTPDMNHCVDLPNSLKCFPFLESAQAAIPQQPSIDVSKISEEEADNAANEAAGG